MKCAPALKARLVRLAALGALAWSNMAVPKAQAKNLA